MASQSVEKSFRLDDTRSVRVNEYKGHVYFHFHDTRKSKTCTLSYDSFKKLLLKGNKILDFARKIKPQSTDRKQKKKIKELDLSEEELMDSDELSE